jgi:hypothetical protein
MFAETMGFTTNPFGPDIDIDEDNQQFFRYLTNLDRSPLRLDQCDALLRPLFCPLVLDLDTHAAHFFRFMQARGYSFKEKPKRSLNSALIVIRGAIGSGKTTLGAWMMSEMAKLPGKPWKSFSVSAEEKDRGADFHLDKLDAQIAEVPKGAHVAALIENVSDTSIHAAISSFNRLQDWPRLFIITTHNLKLLDADERTLSGEARIEIFTIRDVAPADADKYVSHRMRQFHSDERPQFEKQSAIFPFADGVPGRSVQKNSDAGGSPMAMRQLNTNFGEKLSEYAGLEVATLIQEL